MIFERVIYRKEIDPRLELAWTKWIKETEMDLNEMFLIEAVREKVEQQGGVGGVVDVSLEYLQKWNQFVLGN